MPSLRLRPVQFLVLAGLLGSAASSVTAGAGEPAAAGEPVIDKPGYSAFHATDLQEVLSARGITQLIFSGVTTDICVNSTLRMAVDLGYECLMLSDCWAATDRDNHEAALRTIASEGGIFGAVTTSENLLQGLANAAPR